MNILLLDNSGLIYRNKRYCCVEGTGKFATELVELGADVTMFGQKLAVESNVSVFDIESNGIKIAGLWRRSNKIINYLLLYCYAVKYIIKSDFVYIFYPNVFRYLTFICHILGKKYGLYIRGDEGIEDKISFRIYKNATVALTVSPMFTKMVNDVTKTNLAESIRPMVAYDETNIRFDRKYSDKKDFLNMLFLCRIQQKKGILELLQALNKLKEEGNDKFHLKVAGDGDFLEQSKIESQKMGLNSYVDFLGGIYDDGIKAKLFEEADLYILPTYFKEGFPRTLYEAMVFGTPIMTTFVAGIPAIMKDRINCYKLEERSSESIYNALKVAFANYSEFSDYAKNAFDTVEPIISSNRDSHAKQLFKKIN